MQQSPLPIPARPLITPARVWGLVAIACIGLSLGSVGMFQRDLVNLGGLPQLTEFFTASLNPDLSFDFLQLTWNATLVTLSYAVCGTVLSVLIGLVGGIFASEVWWGEARGLGHRPWLMIRSGLAIPRAIHEMIWGLFFVNVFGLDPLVGILAIAIPYGAIVAKVFSEILDETPRQPLMILLNSGVARPAAFLYGLLPQAFLNLLSYTFYRFECSIRSAAVLGVIGAGGLGYEILLSLQSLRYEQLWTLFYALFCLNGSVDIVSAVLRRRLGSPSRLDLNFRKVSRNRSISWDKATVTAGIGLLLLIPFCFWYVGADVSKLWSARTGQLLGDIAASSMPPKLGLSELQSLVPLSLQTLAMSILAIAAAGLGGVVLSFPAARNLLLPGGVLNPNRNGFFRTVLAWILLVGTRSLLLIARAVPAPIWALVMLFVWFPGILPGAIALAIHNLGILGRLMAEVVENLDERPLVALRSQGAPGILVFLYGIVPATLTRFLAYGLYRWEVCMRETVIVGLVGAGGLGRLLTEQLSSFDYRSVVVTLTCFIVLTFCVDWVSSAARRSLR